MNFLTVVCVALALGYANCQLVHGHDLNVLLAKGFARLDVNHDQIFEKEEMEAVIKKDDDNGDGVLQCEEYYNHTSAPKALAQQIFSHLDTDGDCTMSATEMTALMTRMDQSGDGKVTEHEFAHFYSQILKHLGHLDHGQNGGHVVG